MIAGKLEVILGLRDDLTKGLMMSQKALRTHSATLQQAGRALLPLSAGMGLVGAASIKMAMDMNKSMSNVATLIPKSGERIRELKSEVQDLAKETGKSTDDLAGGLYQTISAFGDSADTVKVLEINAKAATAGLATTTDAINLTSAVTKGYGDTSAEAVQKAADLAFITVKLGQTTFPELAASIGAVTPIASALAVSQEELFAGFATLTGVTGNAAEVSTQLKSVLSSMLRPSEDMKAAMKSLGVESVDAMIAQYGMVGSMRELIAQTDGSKEAIGKLFPNVRSLPAVFALAGGQAETFNQKLAEAGKYSGAASEAYAEATGGLNAMAHTWAQAKQQVVVALQKIGDALAPVLSVMLRLLDPLLDKIEAAADAFLKLPPAAQSVGVAIGGIAVAAGPALMALGKLGSLMNSLSPIGKKAKGGLTPLITDLGKIPGVARAASIGLAGLKIGAVAIAAYEGTRALVKLGDSVRGVTRVQPKVGLLDALKEAPSLIEGAISGLRGLNPAVKFAFDYNPITLWIKAIAATFSIAQDISDWIAKKLTSGAEKANAVFAAAAVSNDILLKKIEKSGGMAAYKVEQAQKFADQARATLEKLKDTDPAGVKDYAQRIKSAEAMLASWTDRVRELSGVKGDGPVDPDVLKLSATAQKELLDINREIQRVRLESAPAIEQEIGGIRLATQEKIAEIKASDENSEAQEKLIAATTQLGAVQAEAALKAHEHAFNTEVAAEKLELEKQALYALADPFERQIAMIDLDTQGKMAAVAADLSLTDAERQVKEELIQQADALTRQEAGWAEQQRLLSLLGPSTMNLSQEFNDLTSAVAEMGGLSSLTETELGALVERLQKLVETGRATSEQMDALAVATDEWRAAGAGIKKTMDDQANAIGNARAQLAYLDNNQTAIIESMMAAGASADDATDSYLAQRLALMEASAASISLGDIVGRMRDLAAQGKLTTDQLEELAAVTEGWRAAGAGISSVMVDQAQSIGDANAQLDYLLKNKDAEIRKMREAGASASQANKIYQEQVNQLREETGQVNQLNNAFGSFGQAALEILNSVGDNFESMTAQIVAGSAAAVAGIGQMLTASGDLESMVAGAGAATQGLTGALGLDTSGTGASVGSAIGGAAGGVVGSITGIPGLDQLGALQGQMYGAIFDAFHTSGWEAAMQEVGRDYGTEISEELARQIEDTGERLNLGRFESGLLNLGDIMAEALEQGQGIGDFQQGIDDLFNALEMGVVPAKEGIDSLGEAFDTVVGQIGEDADAIGMTAEMTGRLFEQMASGVMPAAEGLDMLGDAWSALATEAADGSFEAQQAMLAMTLQARAAGEEVAGMGEYVQDALNRASEGLSQMFEGLGQVTQQDAESQATLFSATFWGQVQEQGLLGAIEAMQPAWDAMRASLGESGFQVGEILGPIGRLMGMVNEETRPLFDGIAGLQNALTGLSEAGYMTTDTFAAFGQQAQSAFEQLTDAGVKPRDALMAMAPMLAEMQRNAALYGMELDANSQRLIDQAQDMGIAFPAEPQQVMIDLLSQIVTLMGGEIPASAQAMSQASTDAMNQMGQTGSDAMNQVSESASNAADMISTSYENLGGTVQERMSQVMTTTSEAMNSAADSIGEAVQDMQETAETGGQAFQEAMNETFASVQDTGQSAFDAIRDHLNNLSSGVRIPVDFNYSGSGSMPTGMPGGIPKFRYGGVVNEPTFAMVGEVPEAIVPLSELEGMVGNGGGMSTAEMQQLLASQTRAITRAVRDGIIQGTA